MSDDNTVEKTLPKTPEQVEVTAPLMIRPDLTNEEAILEATRAVRLRIANQILLTGDISEDEKKVNSLGKMLDGLDKQIFTARRVASLDKAADAASDVANAFNNFLSRQGTRVVRHNGDENKNTDGYRPVVPEIPLVELKEGELAPVGEKIDVEGIISTAFARRAPEDDED